MEAAKSSVKKFISKDGKHDTTLHEKTAPSVQNETISQTQHERQTTAVDREVHQDHHHTTEQPVHHSEILPEQHHHKAIPVQERSFEHDDSEKLKRGLDNERKQYYDTQTRVEGEKTREEAPTVVGEHVHHHVHETIQPVVHKQTVEPHVVHTTVPIHEVHHNQAQHHAASSLPPISMDDFKKQGGALGNDKRALPQDGSEKVTHFPDGQPREIRGHKLREDCDTREGGVARDKMRAGNNNTAGAAARAAAASSNGANFEQFTGQRQNDVDPRLGNNGSSNNNTFGTRKEQSKPSLMDKLNPKKDADNDGKAGFMK